MAIRNVPFVAPNEITSGIDALIATANAAIYPVVGYATNASTSAATLAAGALVTARGLSVIQMTGNLGAGAALTLPLAADVIAALTAILGPGSNVVGTTWRLRIARSGTGAFAWTVTTNTGWGTLGGTMTVGQDAWRDFAVTVSSATTCTLQNIGGGTF